MLTAVSILTVESTILYAIRGNHIGMAKLLQGYRLSTDDGQFISTKTEGKKFIKLKPNETVLQVLVFITYSSVHSDSTFTYGGWKTD